MGKFDGVRWADMLDEVDRQRAEIRRTADALAGLTARATSADRSVTVTVNARGMLVGLEMAPVAMRRYRSEQLSEMITGLVAAADRSLRDRREVLLSAAAGAEPGLADVEVTAR
ncbi:YbaB/EbfC family nucleoid-associated protein [Gordonia sp. DT219]|uniref:YbaB/EbfC family nucleoid-associated protein n=1 Tax=Gordonia sp. DT219 TaxID=3416658 RepID=UPI003CF554C3